MQIRIAFAGSLLATLLSAAPALAQVCDGRPGADAGRVLLGAGYSSGDGADEFAVGISGLGKRVYGGASLGTVSYDDFSGSTTTLGGSLGYQLAVGSSGRAQLCPYFLGGFGFGPNDIEGTGIDLSARSVGAGVSWGFKANQSGDFAIVPTVSAGFAYTSVTFTDGVDDLTESDTFGQLGIGLGLVFSRQFAARPAVAIPVGLEGADPRLSILLTLSLGKAR